MENPRPQAGLRPIQFALLPFVFRADRWWEVALLALGEVVLLGLAGWGITATAWMRHPSSPAFYYSALPIWQGIVQFVILAAIPDVLLLLKRGRDKPVVLIGYLAVGVVACLGYLLFDALHCCLKRRDADPVA